MHVHIHTVEQSRNKQQVLSTAPQRLHVSASQRSHRTMDFSYAVTGASGRTKGELVVQLVPHS